MAEQKQQFTGCFIDQDAPTISIEIENVTFTLRGITAGENERIMFECRQPVIDHSQGQGDYLSHFNLQRMMILSVGTALGMYKKLRDEGWSSERPVTLENVEMLADDVITRLYNKHQEFFRRESINVGQSDISD